MRYQGSAISIHIHNCSALDQIRLVARVPGRCSNSKKMDIPMDLSNARIYCEGRRVTFWSWKFWQQADEETRIKEFLLQRSIYRFNVRKIDKTYCRITGELTVLEKASEVIFVVDEIRIMAIPEKLVQYKLLDLLEHATQ